jgi:hypothetical protein
MMQFAQLILVLRKEETVGDSTEEQKKYGCQGENVRETNHFKIIISVCTACASHS